MSNLDKNAGNKNNFWEKLGVSVHTMESARSIVESLFRINKVPCLVGEAGIGKTQLYQQMARDNGWGYIDYYAQIVPPEDIAGLPWRSEEGDFYENVIDKRLYEMTRDNSEGILVFEEVNRASSPTAAAVFAFIDQRGTGGFRLPDGWRIAVAQNPSGGDYSVNELESDHAFRRRVKWVCVREDVSAWLKYAEKQEFNPNVIGYVRSNPGHLLDSAGRAAAHVYANPAAWEDVSLLLNALGEDVDTRTLEGTLESIIGAGMSDSLLDYINNKELVISPRDVIDSYIPKQISARVEASISEGAVDKVTNLIDSVIRELYSYQPPVTKELAANLGLFIKDLPDQLRGQMFSAMHHGTSNADEKHYLAVLNKRLSGDKNYITAIQNQTGVLDRVESELGI